MARTTLPAAQADEAQAPAESQTTTTAARMARIGVIVRLITLAFLILTVSLLASNSTTVAAYNITITAHFNDIYAYRFVSLLFLINYIYI